MTEHLDIEIRKALDAKAYEVDVPSDLAERTLERAGRIEVRLPLWGRIRVWRDARRMTLPATGYPRWLLGVGAAAAAVTLFAVGTFVSMPPDGGERRLSQNVDEGVDSASTDGAKARSQLAGITEGESVPDAATLPQATKVLEPQLVRTAEIRVAVGDFEDSWAKANEIATDHNGFVIESRTSQVEDEIAEGTVRMRVPTSELEAVLKDLRSLGTLAQLDTSGDDISKQIDDVKTKVEDAKDEEEELKALEERATTVSESLALRNRLEDVRGDIEKLKKEQRAFEDQVEFSIVSATIFQDEVAAGRGSSILANALRTSGRLALTVLAGALVVAGALAPLALLALAIWFATRMFRKRRAA